MPEMCQTPPSDSQQPTLISPVVFFDSSFDAFFREKQSKFRWPSSCLFSVGSKWSSANAFTFLSENEREGGMEIEN